MPDAIFEHPRLVAIYDVLDGPRDDLAFYLDIVAELGAGSVLDLGCGTGSLAVLLARRGIAVTGVDPAAQSLRFARTKPDAERVRWVHGDASTLPPLRVDVATMTGNAAQAVVDPAEWAATLRGVHAALRPGGHFVFETRVPAYRAWREWNRVRSYRSLEIPGEGQVDNWVEVTAVNGPLVSFRSTFRFAAHDEQLISDSTLRFRERDEVAADLVGAGFLVVEVRDAPDRPGRELVFIARKDAGATVQGFHTTRQEKS